MTHTCPVCGYDQLPEPPANFLICASCGTEFENDDFWLTHETLRSRWIATGAHWWSLNQKPPRNWSAIGQLLRAGFQLTEADLAAMADTGLTPTGRVEFVNLDLKTVGGEVPRNQTSLDLNPNFRAHILFSP